MTTIKQKHDCAYCGRRIFVVNLRSKKRYCNERCKALHDAFIKKHKGPKAK